MLYCLCDENDILSHCDVIMKLSCIKRNCLEKDIKSPCFPNTRAPFYCYIIIECFEVQAPCGVVTFETKRKGAYLGCRMAGNWGLSYLSYHVLHNSGSGAIFRCFSRYCLCKILSDREKIFHLSSVVFGGLTATPRHKFSFFQFVYVYGAGVKSGAALSGASSKNL